ncbi:MAG: ankyrin repeat domain-containing protein [Bdellovibrionia bacterium]
MRKITLLLSLLLLTAPAWALSKTTAPSKMTLNNEKQLMEAIEMGNLKLSEKLIADPAAKLNFQGHQKLTPLMMAVAFERESLVDLLIQKKVDLELKNEAGDTALAMAVGNEKNSIAKKLIAAGAKVDVSCGELDNTLLMCAAQTNNLDIAKEILKKAPKEVSKKNNKGQTAADLAKEYGNKDILKVLKLAK